ncbi:hypothetical protein TL16_g06346, partial [Triparma laevis f. inornata]
LLQTAIKSAHTAGSIMTSATSIDKEVSVTKVNKKDLLTKIDPMCEAAIKSTILESFPDHLILGEESVEPGASASSDALSSYLSESESLNKPLWIIDPIDGTTNYVHDLRYSSPSIACSINGSIVVACIYDPYANETFTAIKNSGACLNGKPIHVKPETCLEDSVIAMGAPPGKLSAEKSIIGFEALLPKVRTIRMLGSAALMLSWVATGRLNCYWEWDLSSWDVAAGGLIVEEAGGRMRGLMMDDGRFEVGERRILADDGRCGEEVRRILKESGV